MLLEQLRARHARHGEMQIDVGDHLQRLAVREPVRAARQRDVTGEARGHVADARLGALELEAARQRIDRPAQAERHRDVLDRIAGQRVALQGEAHHRQLAAEAHRVARPVEVERGVERGVRRREHRLRQHVGDAPQRELLGAQTRARPVPCAGSACPFAVHRPPGRRRSCRADRSPGRWRRCGLPAGRRPDDARDARSAPAAAAARRSRPPRAATESRWAASPQAASRCRARRRRSWARALRPPSSRPAFTACIRSASRWPGRISPLSEGIARRT